MMGIKQKRPERGVFAGTMAERESAGIELLSVSRRIKTPSKSFIYWEVLYLSASCAIV